jgi:hypothetical protein
LILCKWMVPPLSVSMLVCNGSFKNFKSTLVRHAVLLDGQNMVPATLVSCIDPDLFENLVCL